MRTRCPLLILAVVLPSVPFLGAASQGVPLGHPDFRPSPDRPIGWRGDRSGAFPGATPVRSWNSETGENIVWRCRLPAPSWSQPIVVGDKVFTTADPDLLICIDVASGRILWQRTVDHLAAAPRQVAEKARAELAFVDSLFPIYVDGCRLLAKLQEKAKEKGIDNTRELQTAVLYKGAVDPHWPKIKEYRSDEYDRAAADPELAPMLEELIALRRQYGFTFIDPRRGDNWSAINTDHRDSKAGLDLQKRLDALITEADIWAWPRQNWYACCTMTFATPCSDGDRVYVAFANNQVAAFDLEGEQQWLVWAHPPPEQKQGGVLHTRFIPSPLLVGGRLVVNQNGELRVHDAATGRRIWGSWDPHERSRDKRDRSRGSRSGRPFPEGCSPIHFALPLGKETLDVITDGGGKLFRLEDGKVVATGLPVLGKGSSPIPAGDIYVWKSGGDNRPYPLGACRLTARSRDEVTCTTLWTDDDAGSGEYTAVVHDGTISNGNGIWNLVSGERQHSGKKAGGWNSPILAGDWLIGLRGTQVQPIGALQPVTSNVLVDTVDQDDPEWNRTVYCGQTKPSGNSSPFAHGNRLYFRTAGHLWCIGNPEQR